MESFGGCTNRLGIMGMTPFNLDLEHAGESTKLSIYEELRQSTQKAAVGGVAETHGDKISWAPEALEDVEDDCCARLTTRIYFWKFVLEIILPPCCLLLASDSVLLAWHDSRPVLSVHIGGRLRC